MDALPKGGISVAELEGRCAALQAFATAVIRTFPIDRLPTLKENLDHEVKTAADVLREQRAPGEMFDALGKGSFQLTHAIEERMREMGIR